VAATLIADEHMQLIEPTNVPRIDGIDSPREFYWVLKEPAPLAGMKLPRNGFPWSGIADLGFRRVVALHPGSYDPAPLSFLFQKKLEDLVGGGPPTDPSKERGLIEEAVYAVIKALRSGDGVVVHCWGGRGRTGTVIGCALRSLGHEPSEVIAYLDRVHKLRGKSGWPESPWQSELVQSWKAS
jgi:hypothetical protein